MAPTALLVSWTGIAAHTAGAATPSPTTAPPPVTSPGSATTVVPIGSQLPKAPVTLPLTSRPESAHVDPLLAKLSLGGFALFLLFLPVQAVLTRRRRKHHWTL